MTYEVIRQAGEQASRRPLVHGPVEAEECRLGGLTERLGEIHRSLEYSRIDGLRGLSANVSLR